MSDQTDAFLDRLEVAEPCDASWDAMRGDDRKRFCGDCKLHVYNFSAISTREAETLLENATDRVCGRFLRRADGTVITQDCGPLRLALQRRVRRLRVAASAVFAFLASFASVGCDGVDDGPATPPRATGTTGTTATPNVVPPPTKVEPVELMGEVCDPREAMGRIRAPLVAPKPGSETPGAR